MKNALATKDKLFSKEENLSFPVLKWAGGKTQLLPIIRNNYPQALLEGNVKTYIEPFLGGAAVFLDIVQNYNIDHAVLFDVNPDLVNLYKMIKLHVDDVGYQVEQNLKIYQSRYENERSGYYYSQREMYNSSICHGLTTAAKVKRAALTIFLNKTCFNGLFRVNQMGYFNVPVGYFKKPPQFDYSNLKKVSCSLQQAAIHQADYKQLTKYITPQTFIYYDPPYLPVSNTSHFNKYNKSPFGYEEQRKLASLYASLSKKGVSQLLSNSDPEAYSGVKIDSLYPNALVQRIRAKRFINSKGSLRGEVVEVLVRNY